MGKRTVLTMLSLGVLGLVAAPTAAYADPPPPAPFTCSADMHAPVISMGDFQTPTLAQTGCSGGTGDGWTVNMTPQYQSSTGAWDYINWEDYPNQAATAKMPLNSCSGGGHYANGVLKTLFVDWTYPRSSCSDHSDLSDDDSYTDLPIGTKQDGTNITGHLCGSGSGGVQGWRIHFHLIDAGDSANDDVINSNENSC